MRNSRPLNAALFGIGLNTYWPQFTGLEARLTGYLGQIEQQLTSPEILIHNGGLVDSVEKSDTLAAELKQVSPDVIIIAISTYALSSTVLPLVLRFRC